MAITNKQLMDSLTLLHAKFESIDKLVAVHEEKLKNQQGSINGLFAGLGVVLFALVGGVVNLIFKK